MMTFSRYRNFENGTDHPDPIAMNGLANMLGYNCAREIYSKLPNFHPDLDNYPDDVRVIERQEDLVIMAGPKVEELKIERMDTLTNSLGITAIFLEIQDPILQEKAIEAVRKIRDSQPKHVLEAIRRQDEVLN